MARGTESPPDLFSGKVELPPAVAVTIGVPPAGSKRSDAFKTISETAGMLSLPQHVLRFWESKFPQIKPLKLRGGRRYYRPQDIELLFTIKQLLYKQGYTIKGARRAIHQARRKGVAPQDLPAAKAPRRAEAPLFDTLAAEARPAKAATAAAAPRRQELKQIHDELLSLRDLLHSLPAAKAEA